MKVPPIFSIAQMWIFHLTVEETEVVSGKLVLVVVNL